MGRKRMTGRHWLILLKQDEAHIRCSYQRERKHIQRFTVQLEIMKDGVWQPIVRYDNAHNFCHRDTLHADGTQEKVPWFVGTVNQTFTNAIDELKRNWEQHRDRFLGELER